jgi:hypothetical protein
MEGRVPGVGHRGRSIRLNQAPKRLGSSSSHSRSDNSSFGQRSTETLMAPAVQQAPYSETLHSSVINVSKVRGPSSNIRPFGVFPDTGSYGTEFFDGPFVPRAVTAPEGRLPFQMIHRRAFSHESGLRGASSALQEICAAEEIVVPPRFEIPYSITEIDETSPPRMVGSRRYGDFDNDGMMSANTSRPETAVKPSRQPNIDKELPQLPSYLVPSPLFSHSFPDPHEQAKELFIDFNFQQEQSRFSAWSEDLGHSDADDSELETGDGQSSTFSSVWDSGHSSPTLDPFYLSLGSPDDIGGNDGNTQTSDASRDLEDYLSPVRGDERKSEAKNEPVREMTQMEKLLDEFEYLGAALM